MPEPIMIPDSGAPTASVTPSIQPAGVVVEGAAPPPQAVSSSAPASIESVPTKGTFGFLKQIDWVEAIIVVAAITGIVYAINYYSTHIKSQNGAIATLNNDVADLQNKVQSLLQKENSSSTKNASGDINRFF